MQGASQVVKLGLAFAVGLLAWNYAARLFVEHTVNSPSAKADAEYFKMEREAQAKYKSESTAAAVSRYAREKASQELAAVASDDERAFKAAQIFMGFYLVNTRARPEFCRELRVDIGNFAAVFSELYQPQYDRAAALLGAKGMSVDDVWSTLQRSLADAVRQDMGWMGGSYGLSMAKACEEIAQRPRTFAGQLNFVNRQPDVERALMGP